MRRSVWGGGKGSCKFNDLVLVVLLRPLPPKKVQKLIVASLCLAYLSFYLDYVLLVYYQKIFFDHVMVLV